MNLRDQIRSQVLKQDRRERESIADNTKLINEAIVDAPESLFESKELASLWLRTLLQNVKVDGSNFDEAWHKAEKVIADEQKKSSLGGYLEAAKGKGTLSLVKILAKKPGVRNPKALAAAIGRRKFGKAKFQAMAAAGRK